MASLSCARALAAVCVPLDWVAIRWEAFVRVAIALMYADPRLDQATSFHLIQSTPNHESNFQPPTHRVISFFRRPSTSLGESAEEGSFRWASNRVSASFSSSAVKPWSSNSITRRTNACRSCGFQLGSSWSTSVTLIFLSMPLRAGNWSSVDGPSLTK